LNRFRVTLLLASISIFLILVSVFANSVLSSQIPVNSPPPTHPAQQLEETRKELFDLIFRDYQYTHVNEISLDCSREISPNPYCTFGVQVEKLTIQIGTGMKSDVYLLFPENGNGNAIIYHRGHETKFSNNFPENLHNLLVNGFTVAAVSMPLCPTVSEGSCESHELIEQIYGVGSAQGLQPFLLPVYETVGFLSSKGLVVSMVGLSGGGWTTVLAASLFPEIRFSLSVAGSEPTLSLTQDYEQRLPGIYPRYGYLDLYKLMTFENRLSVLVYNTQDSCCFASNNRQWEWENDLIEEVAETGGKLLVIHNINSNHDIETSTLLEFTDLILSSPTK
jgi:hypothetical protein